MGNTASPGSRLATVTTSNSINDTGIIVVGAGIVGATFATLLARTGLNIALIESSSAAPAKDESVLDPRVLAITKASERILSKANIWDKIECSRIGCFREMHVWDENGNGEIHFDSAAICQPTLGYIIESELIRLTLHTSLENMDTVTWYRPARPVLLERHDDAIVLGLDDGRRLRSDLIVAADGGNSAVRDLAGIAHDIHDYQQSALVSVVETEKPHGNIARQRFMTLGPLAFLPMAEPSRCGIVWSTSPEHAGDLANMEATLFRMELEKAFTGTLGKIIDSGPRAVFPLRRAQAEHYCQPRLALIGDTAHSVHPLAGQGANQGLLDAATLAEIIIETRSKGRDPGAYSVLRRYERWRRGENYRMMMIFEGFKYLFENQDGSVRWLRNTGMDLMDSVPLAKEWIMYRAMGLEGDLPALARGLP